MKRCICGYSSQFPICDGQHKQQGWSCARSPQKQVALGVLAGENYFSLAEKLAHHLRAQVVMFSDKTPIYQNLLILSDGTELEEISSLVEQIDYKEAQLIAIGISPLLLGPQFPRVTSISHISSKLKDLWPELLIAISERKTIFFQQKTKKIFVSHATKDSKLLTPVIEYLRRYFKQELFLCSDSISTGELWYTKISTELEQSDVVIAMHSKNFLESHFCSFEMGMTRALRKRLLIIGLDSAPLPMFLQDVQTEFLAKNQAQKAWLNSQEALIDLIISKL